MPMEGLGVGCVVHYTRPDYTSNQVGGDYPLMCHAAIITRVVDGERGVVNLQWFDDNSRFVVRNVLVNETEKTINGTWHWPEQV